MQPRAKSRVFASVDIRSHPFAVTFHFFLPQICHSENWLLIGAKNAKVTCKHLAARNFLQHVLSSVGSATGTFFYDCFIKESVAGCVTVEPRLRILN
ncbi:MAG TPA: hypothetical protein VE931_02105, partial [Pyrinomonadaceae bacterium]|nr:hypothetical protein [Pyrinomonadaceae bacterium]